MIVDNLENFGGYISLNPLFPQVAGFLASNDLKALKPGKTVLVENELIVNVSDINPKTKEEAKLETHNEFIDVQIPLYMDEIMGYTPAPDCLPENAPYNPEKDLTFFEGQAQSYITVKPGMFAIFFPQDGHAPGIVQEATRKVIFKVKV